MKFGEPGSQDEMTARRRTQMQLQLMSKVFYDGVYPKLIEDLSGCIMDVNHAAVGAFGELLGGGEELAEIFEAGFGFGVVFLVELWVFGVVEEAIE